MKRLFDLGFSSIIFILLLPIFFIICIAVKSTSKGPIFFTQYRIGKDDSIFKIYKFRSMRVDTPNVATNLLDNPGSWITKVGRFLRVTSLDEIPQLLNIIKGEMSIVGPRPALVSQTDLLNARREKKINILKPGLTGWAQVNGRDELSVQKKVKFDLEYLENKSLLFDLKIIIFTIYKVIKRDGIVEGKLN
ncbi:MAG: sugar transferase [Sarcina sp.]